MRAAYKLLTGVAFAAMTATAQAADMPVRRAAPAAAPVPVVAVYDWTGGMSAPMSGGAWADSHWFDVTPLDPVRDEGADTGDGFLGGAQIGFNWQTGAFVIGAEVQGSLADLSGSRRSAFFRGLTNHTDVDSLVTVAARAGIAHHNWLWFAKLGGASANSDFRITGFQRTSWSQPREGWMAGGGLEYGLTPNCSIKIEYNFIDFGSDTTRGISCGQAAEFNEKVEQDVHVVMAGVNFRLPLR